MTRTECTNERLFFALWPTQAIQTAMYDLGQQLSSNIAGRLIQASNLHITLAFIGNVPPTTKHCLQQAATTINEHAFTLYLDKLGYWEKPRIVWLGASQLPDALSKLVTQLNTQLRPCDYRPDARPYQAHVTLFREVTSSRKLPVVPPLIWSVNDFCLIRSITSQQGVQYEVINRWRLLSA
jgi:2'-5' RNA ligase